MLWWKGSDALKLGIQWKEKSCRAVAPWIKLLINNQMPEEKEVTGLRGGDLWEEHICFPKEHRINEHLGAGWWHISLFYTQMETKEKSKWQKVSRAETPALQSSLALCGIIWNNALWWRGLEQKDNKGDWREPSPWAFVLLLFFGESCLRQTEMFILWCTQLYKPFYIEDIKQPNVAKLFLLISLFFQ